jgi:hypothetical protein
MSSSDANRPHSQGDEFASGPPFDPDACQPTKAGADALTRDERRGAHIVNLVLQRSAMLPGEVVEVILPDNLDEEEDYIEDEEFLHADGTLDLEKALPNSDDNPIEYIYTRDATGRVVHVDSRRFSL